MNHGAVIASEQVTGLVLAGGRGSRMGGVDKGLQVFRGMPLAMHALMRLAPQVSSVIISANRNLAAYESMGAAVFPDSLPDFAGPLAGFLTGLSHCETPYLATVPCDSPLFPANLIRRLGAALLEADAEIAMAAIDESGRMRAQPVFCLLKCDLLESLVRYTRSGERKIDRWTAAHRCVEVPFDERAAFSNVNTLAELRDLEPKA